MDIPGLTIRPELMPTGSPPPPPPPGAGEPIGLLLALTKA